MGAEQIAGIIIGFVIAAIGAVTWNLKGDFRFMPVLMAGYGIIIASIFNDPTYFVVIMGITYKFYFSF